MWSKRGQVLATFAPDTVRADLAQQAAAVAEAEAALAEAEANAARARTLQDSGAMSVQQINQYLTAAKTAAARLRAAKAARESGQLRVSYTRGSRRRRCHLGTVGNGRSGSRQRTRIIPPDSRQPSRMACWVTASELAKVAPGRVVTVTTPTGASVSGKVRVVAAPTVDATSRNAIVYVDLAKHADARAGMFARGEFAVGATTALSPAAAGRSAARWLQLRVQAGRRQQGLAGQGADRGRVGDRVEITAGLKAGEEVVATGAAFLAEGDVVRIAVAAAAAPPPAARQPAGQ